MQPEPLSAAPTNRNAPSGSTDAATSGVSSGRYKRITTRSGATPGKPSDRLVSLDAFRGFIMMMLAASGFGLLGFSRIDEASPVWQFHDRALWQQIGVHFNHPLWVSSYDYFKVSFWDLIQPAFMFMVGAAMPFSNAKRTSLGHGLTGRGFHALTRSVALVLLGVFLSSKGHDRTFWVFPNVLCQIGLGYFFAWMLMNLQWKFQVAALILILAGYWTWFFVTPPPADYDYAAVKASSENKEVFEGKFAAWSKNANAAYRFDEWLLPRLRSIPEPSAKPEAALSNGRKWRLASLPFQETDEPTPEGAADETDAAPEAITAEGTGSEGAASTEGIPGPVGSPDESSALVDSTAGAVADAPVAAPAELAKPKWYRLWFLSNEEPYEPNGGGYTTLNFVPSIGTMLLGILCGQLLLFKEISRWAKLGILIVAAAACLGLGIAADQTICPVVKRIWTPSWVLFSGGYVIGMLALFYLLFDIAPFRLLAFPLVVVGTNSILTYMLGQTISDWMQDSFVKVHLSGVITNVFGTKALDPQWYGPITLPTTVFLLYWLFLLWLYRQKIFLKL